MFKWLVNTYMKDYIDELVDQRLKDKMFERYYEHKGQELKDRIEKLRRSFHTQTSGVQENKPTQVLSSANVRRSDSQSQLPSETSKAKLKNAEMDDLRAKLTGKKK